MALPPELPASPILELLAGRVVTVPFDGSAVVEGMIRPTTASSQDVVIRGTLADGLANKRFQIRTSQSINLTRALDHDQLNTHLSLVVCEELRRFLATDRVPLGCPDWVSSLGLALRSLPSSSALSPASAQAVSSSELKSSILAEVC